jgi:hypothetical protein
VPEDEVHLRLLAPDEGRRSRGDMDPQFTRLFPANNAEELLVATV